MQLFIKTLTGKILTIEHDPYSDTVFEVKKIIREREGVPVSRQRIIFAGIVLKDGHLFSNYNVQKSSCLHLVILPRTSTRKDAYPFEFENFHDTVLPRIENVGSLKEPVRSTNLASPEKKIFDDNILIPGPDGPLSRILEFIDPIEIIYSSFTSICKKFRETIFSLISSQVIKFSEGHLHLLFFGDRNVRISQELFLSFCSVENFFHDKIQVSSFPPCFGEYSSASYRVGEKDRWSLLEICCLRRWMGGLEFLLVEKGFRLRKDSLCISLASGWSDVDQRSKALKLLREASTNEME